MKSFTIPIDVLESSVCESIHFEESSRFVEGVGVVYPDGWNVAEARRLLTEPNGAMKLRWLAVKRLIPWRFGRVQNFIRRNG